MLTREEYEELYEQALDELEYLRGIDVKQDEIIAIMTKDVLSASFIWNAPVYESFNIQYINTRMKFQEYDIGVIDNGGESGIFRFATKEMHFYPGMKLGTLVTGRNDCAVNKIYELRNTDPPSDHLLQFADTGMTISFESDLSSSMMGDLRAMTGAATQNVMQMATPEFSYREEAVRPYICTYAGEPYFASEYSYQWDRTPTWSDAIQMYQKCKKKSVGHPVESAKTEIDTQPDTKAIDEFLSSFKILESAT